MPRKLLVYENMSEGELSESPDLEPNNVIKGKTKKWKLEHEESSKRDLSRNEKNKKEDLRVRLENGRKKRSLMLEKENGKSTKSKKNPLQETDDDYSFQPESSEPAKDCHASSDYVDHEDGEEMKNHKKIKFSTSDNERSPASALTGGLSSSDESENDDKLPPYLPAIMGCRSVSEFQCLNKIEEGTYGVVYRAQDKRTNEIVALKRLKMEREKEGFPITSLREVSTLLKAQHENIVTVREIVVGSNMDSIFMVMDYVEHDLKSLMEVLKSRKQYFLPGQVKCLLSQLLSAVAHLHDNWILHRDLKTSNILLSHSGILKVGDFGLAREYGSPLKAYTSIVVTLWYRAPELLLGCKEYSTPIDMWSVGCIFGELLILEAIFQGKFEADQINRIFKELGTPSDATWPGYSELSLVKKASFTFNPNSNLRRRFSSRLSELGIDLLQRFLTYDPSKRITAEEALNHTYLKEAPYPIHPSMLPTWPAKSESHGSRKAQSPKPPSGGRAFKQLNDDAEGDVHAGFHMNDGPVDRQSSMHGPGFSLKF